LTEFALSPTLVQLHVELQEVQPWVWRRLLVGEGVTLRKLQAILQRVMGWSGRYPHEFEVGCLRYRVLGKRRPLDPAILPESGVRLTQLLDGGLKRFIYRYPMGEGITHLIRVENFHWKRDSAPLVMCISGAGRCPPGSPEFDLAAVNAYLRKIKA
jgi:hypothetical protein